MNKKYKSKKPCGIRKAFCFYNMNPRNIIPHYITCTSLENTYESPGFRLVRDERL